MGMDLAVFAVAPGADEPSARAAMKSCYAAHGHAEGDLDERIVRFYGNLRAVYPDFPPYRDDSPLASSPPNAGIDHVFMNIRWSADDRVLHLIERLAAEHQLVLYDPQDDELYLPPA